MTGEPEELTGAIRVAAQTLTFGGGVISLLASLGLGALEAAPAYLVQVTYLGLGLMLLGIVLLVLFLPLRTADHEETP